MRTIRWDRYCVIGCLLLLTPHVDIHKIKQASWHTETTGDLSQQKQRKKSKKQKTTETNDEYKAYTDGNFREKKNNTRQAGEFHQHIL